MLVVAAVSLVGELFLPRPRGRVVRRRGSGLMGAVYLFAPALVVIVLLLGVGLLPFPPGLRRAAGWPGIALVAGGTALRLWGAWTLGGLHLPGAAIVEGHVLVTRGPYRWLRHPAYLGSLTRLFGFALAVGSATLLALFVAALPGYLRQMRAEDRLLADAFGNPSDGGHGAPPPPFIST